MLDALRVVLCAWLESKERDESDDARRELSLKLRELSYLSAHSAQGFLSNIVPSLDPQLYTQLSKSPRVKL